MDPRTATLEEAKQWLRERFADGANCPCCHQHVKLYKRKLNSGMAAGLVIMYCHHQAVGRQADFDTHDLLFQGRRLDADFAKLRFWGLIERVDVEPDGPNHPRRSSKYRITDDGCRFVERKVSVPKYVHLYNDSPVRRVETTADVIDIDNALGSKFNYAELMISS